MRHRVKPQQREEKNEPMTRDKFLRQNVATFVAAVIMLSATSYAWGGRIDPGLKRLLDSAPPSEQHAVIVKLADKVDYPPLHGGFDTGRENGTHFQGRKSLARQGEKFPVEHQV